MTKAGSVCLGLDAWLIGGSLLTLAWSLALAQAAKSEGPGVAHIALSLAYPLLDIALVSMVLALHFRRSAVNRTAVNTAIGALALTVMCDALFTSPLMHYDYRSASWWTRAGSRVRAPGVRPLGRAPCGGRPARPRPARRHGPYPRGARAPTGAARRTQQQAPLPGAEHSRYPAARPIAGSLAALTPYLAAAVCTLGMLYTSSTAAVSTAWSC